MNVSCKVVNGFKFEAFAAVDGISGFLGCGTKPFDFGLIFLLALLQQTESLANHLAGIAEAPGSDACLNEAVKVFCQVHIAGWHEDDPPTSTLSVLAIAANSDHR